MLIACIMMSACSSDDELKLELTGEYLEATTWDAVLTDAQSSTQDSGSDHFVMQFLTKESGTCIAAYGYSDYQGRFSYHITKDMLSFSGSMIGNWSVVEHSKTKMVLRSFQPTELNLVLTKI